MVKVILCIVYLTLALIGPTHGKTKLHPDLQRQLVLNNGSTTTRHDILIHVKPMTSDFHRKLKKQSIAFKERLDRTQFLYEALKQHSNDAQEDVHRLLAEHQTVGCKLWMINAISVSQASHRLIEQLDQHDSIEQIDSDPSQTRRRHLTQTTTNTAAASAVADPTWAIKNANIDKVHEKLRVTGKGVVIGVIDSGFSLNTKPRGHKIVASSLVDPGAFTGHGDMVTALAAGNDPYGVARDSKVVVCQVREGVTQRLSENLSGKVHCASFMICPNDQCQHTARVINLSTGISSFSDQSHKTKATVLDVWRKIQQAWDLFDIIPVVPTGNIPTALQDPTKSCDSIVVEKALPHAIRVGAINRENRLAKFSVHGRYADDVDVVAPGSKICIDQEGSSEPQCRSGTSLASPVVAGTIALMLSVNAKLDFDQVKTILTQTAEQHSLQSPELQCPLIDYMEFPNVGYGYGKLDAYGAVQRARTPPRQMNFIPYDPDHTMMDDLPYSDISRVEGFDELWRKKHLYFNPTPQDADMDLDMLHRVEDDDDDDSNMEYSTLDDLD